MPKAAPKKAAPKKTAPKKNTPKKPRASHTSARRDLAVKLFKQKLAKNEPFTAKDVLLQAGYSEVSANQYTHVMRGIKPQLAEFVEKMEEHRADVMELLPTRIKRASYPELIRALEVLTKNIQLLSGGPTENIALSATFRQNVEHLL